MELHDSQKTLINYLKDIDNLEGLSYWDIARETGLKNAQNVIHHLKQLERYGYVRRDLGNPDKFEILKDPIEDVVYINLYGFAHCGNEGDFFSDGNLKDKVAISTKLFGVKDYKNTFLVKAKGDSMTPYIRENDLVLIEQQSDVDNGSIGLVIEDGKPKIKKITKKNRNEIILSSLNPAHKDHVVKIGQELRIIGRAKGIIHGMSQHTH